MSSIITLCSKSDLRQGHLARHLLGDFKLVPFAEVPMLDFITRTYGNPRACPSNFRQPPPAPPEDPPIRRNQVHRPVPINETPEQQINQDSQMQNSQRRPYNQAQDQSFSPRIMEWRNGDENTPFFLRGMQENDEVPAPPPHYDFSQDLERNISDPSYEASENFEYGPNSDRHTRDLLVKRMRELQKPKHKEPISPQRIRGIEAKFFVYNCPIESIGGILGFIRSHEGDEPPILFGVPLIGGRMYHGSNEERDADGEYRYPSDIFVSDDDIDICETSDESEGEESDYEESNYEESNYEESNYEESNYEESN